MEENIDIYMDLPDFDLTKSDINDQSKTDNACDCEKLKKKFNSLTSEFESIKKINQNLETNMASLLKTAKAEIARKDKTIEELRNQLDNAAFRRNNRSLHFSTFRSYQHNAITEMYETSLMNSEEDTFMSQQIEPHTEYKSKKPQNNTDQVPVTIFGERLHKRIMDEREERRLRASSKLSSETNVNKIPEECIVESDKENGSESSINNANECNAIARSSSSGTSYKKDSGKRLNEENDTCKNKRLKTEDNEDRENYDTDYNHIAQYDTKDDLTKLEDQLRVMYSFKKEQVSLETKHRASSEYEDTRQARSCKNEWRKQERTSSTRDYDDGRTSKGSVDSSRNHRTASNERLNSDHQHDNYINGYRKNDYRHGSSSSRSYSKSRSDYESSSRSRRLRDKSSRTYRDRKYDNYKYDGRHKSDRSRRGYDSKETSDARTRYSSRERSNLRDKLRHTTSDVEDRESKSGSHRSNKYDNRRLMETAANVSEDKRSHRGGKAVIEIDFRTSSNRTVVNTAMDHNVESTEQYNAKNEPRASASSAESTSTYAIDESKDNTTDKNKDNTRDRSNLEEGEISESPHPSPEKKCDSAKIFTTQATEENVAKDIQVEGAKVENAPVDIQTAHISGDSNQILQNSIVTMKELGEMTETGARQTEAAVPVSQENAKDTVHAETMRLNPADERVATTDGHNDSDASNQHSGGSVTDYIILDALAIEEVYSNNNDVDDCKNCIDENLRDYSNDGFVRLEEMYDFSNESVVRSEEMGDANAEGTVEVNKVDNPGTNNDICQTDHEDVKSSKDATQVETVPNCNSADKCEVSGGNETSHQISDKSNGEASRTCLDDHNYVRDAVIDASVPEVSIPEASVPNASVPDVSVPDASVPNATPSTLECREPVSSTAMPKETEAEEMVNIQSIDVKKTTLSGMKNKKDQNSKAVVISRRRKAVTLSDNNASMTVLVNTDSARSSLVDNSTGDKSDSVSKPRACKLARTVKPLCK